MVSTNVIAMPEKPVDVIYVIGCGRSGTTILDMMLAEDKKIISGGELYYYGLEDAHRTWSCPCGKTIEECLFWSAVTQNYLEKTGDESLSSCWNLKQKFEGPRFHGATRTITQSKLNSETLRKYHLQQYWLIKSLMDIGGGNYVVDSSGLPTRGLNYVVNPYINVRFVHLVRDGRGVAASLKKFFCCW